MGTKFTALTGGHLPNWSYFFDLTVISFDNLFEMARRGAFIVVEGLDRSGKTTQAEIMRRRIQAGGREVVCIKFPGEFHLSDLFSFPLIVSDRQILVAKNEIDRSTPIGKMIDSYLHSQSDLDDHVVHLLFSANRWEFALVLYSYFTSLSNVNNGTIIFNTRSICLACITRRFPFPT